MPRYDFRCITCDTTFEVQRPMSQSGDPATCPQGHDDTRRLLSVFAAVGANGAASSLQATAPRPQGGGCCGGGCGCG